MMMTLSGASGTGKTTIMRALLDRIPLARPLVSMTTRGPRPTDVAGEYRYVTSEEFEAMERRDEFLWTAGVGTTRYGTLASELHKTVEHQEIVWVTILVPERVPNIRDYARAQGQEDRIRSFYIINPPEDTLRRRMRERGDTEEKIEGRIRECRDFLERARSLDVPFTWVEDENDLEKKIGTILRHIQT